jgi:hypothetical protein
MDDVQEEEKEEGDSDSVGDADKISELSECVEEPICDRLQVLIKEEDEPEESVQDNEGMRFFGEEGHWCRNSFCAATG